MRLIARRWIPSHPEPVQATNLRARGLSKITKGEREVRSSQHTRPRSREKRVRPHSFPRGRFHPLSLGDKFRFSMTFHFHFGPDSKGMLICDSQKRLASGQIGLAFSFKCFPRTRNRQTPEMYYKRKEKCTTRIPHFGQQYPLCRTIARHVKIHVSVSSIPNPHVSQHGRGRCVAAAARSDRPRGVRCYP